MSTFAPLCVLAFAAIHPGYELNSQPAPSTHCKHIFCSKRRTRAGEFCGAALDLRDNHARGCEVGGAILAFHNWARDWLKRTLERWHPGVPVSKEQHVPAWDYQLPPRPDARPGERPPISEARLDIRIPEPSGRGRMINVDIWKRYPLSGLGWGLQEVTAFCPSLSDIDPASGGFF